MDFSAYVGSYTDRGGAGIYLLRSRGGVLSCELAAPAINPSYLALAPNQRLYCVNELLSRENEEGGSVTAFSMGSAGELEQIGVSGSGGGAPVHLTYLRRNRVLLVANYCGPTVGVLALDNTGSFLGDARTVAHAGVAHGGSRQDAPHPHSVVTDPGEAFAVAADLGLDQLLVYRIETIGTTTTLAQHSKTALRPGCGVRSLVFHPTEPWAIAVGELDSSLTTLRFSRGTLSLHVVTSSLPPGEASANNTAGALLLSNDGRYLYVSNRGHDSIVVFRCRENTEALHFVQSIAAGGRGPRHIAFTPDGSHLLVANTDSDHVSLFGVDTQTGRLSATRTVFVPAPACVLPV